MGWGSFSASFIAFNYARRVSAPPKAGALSTILGPAFFDTLHLPVNEKPPIRLLPFFLSRPIDAGRASACRDEKIEQDAQS